MESLLTEIRACTVCKGQLPNDPLPIVQASVKSRILVVGKAPGRLVQESETPWKILQ